MATGSGLDAQLGAATETTWGTAVTPTRFIEFNSETLKRNPTWLEPTGLRIGTKYKRASRVRQSRVDINGDITFEHATKGMGLFWKHALGSAIATPAQIGTTTAYKQIHTPGDHRGMGLTLQVGRPQPSDAVVKPFTYSGCKVSQWQFQLKDNSIPTLKLTVDGRSEDSTTMALGAASYLSGATVFDFSQAALKLGGSAATASGETTITGGVAVATIVKDITITGKSPLDVARFGLGNAGQKAEQLENATPDVTGTLTAEFGKAELYDVFANNTTVALELDLTGSQVGTSGNNFALTFVIPALKLKTAPPNVSGPGVVQMSTTFEVYSDEVNPVIQVKVVSDETTL